VDNGDATSFESFQAQERHAYNGLALVVVRTKAGELGASLEGASRADTGQVILQSGNR